MKKMIIVLALFILCGCSGVIYDGEDAADKDLIINEDNDSYDYATGTNIVLDDEDVYINEGGTYILSGTLEDASIIVEVDENEEVQLVLDNITVNANDFAAIYIIEADEVTITLAEGSVNTLSDGSSHTQIDANNVDAVIYSKADLTINGTGSLNIEANYQNGIVSKDDLIITGGNYYINAVKQGICAKDCLKIADGIFNITCGADALKSDNEEDEDRGYIYITGGSFNVTSNGDAIYAYSQVKIEGGEFTITTLEGTNATSQKGIKSDGDIYISDGIFNMDTVDDAIHSDSEVYISDGTFTINSEDDAIHADARITIDGGKFDITAHEGIEATYIVINDGDIHIDAKDDAINASQTVSTYTATIEINGGNITISVAQGDTDAIDSNGYIYVNGGTLDITAQSPFDYDLGAEYNGGTIIVNGVETNAITASQMGGFGQMPVQH